MPLESDAQIQVPRPMRARAFALPRETNLLAFAHALRNSHLERLHGTVRIAPKADRFSAAVQRFLDRHQQVRLDVAAALFFRRARKAGEATGAAGAAPSAAEELLE